MFNLQPKVLGVDFGKSSLRFAALRKKGKRWVVTALKEVVDAESISLFYRSFQKEILVSALPTRDILVRQCEIPLKKAKDIFATLDFHVEPILPFSLEKAIVQAEITSQLENASLLNVFALRKDYLQGHLERLKQAHLEPEIVTSRLHAFSALSQLLPQTHSPFLIFHEGEEELSLILMEKGLLLGARSIDPQKPLLQEIQKALLSFATTHKHKPFEFIYFFGKQLEIKTLLEKESGKPVHFPSSPFLTMTQEELIHYGLALGIALAYQGINFRQQECAYPYPFKRLKKPSALYFSLTLLLSASLYFFNECSLIQKKMEMRTAYEALISQERLKAPSLGKATAQDYALSLSSLTKEFQARPELFPLLPQVPKVKELLSWLTSLVKQQGEEAPSITLESLNYQMVKHPDFSQQQEHYLVRVDLEFHAKDPNSARSFQEALKSSNSLIDTQKEIEWLFAKGKYRASFFLKDKTRYN